MLIIRSWMLLSTVLLAFILVLQLTLWVGPLSIPAAYQQAQKVEQLKEENQQLQNRNQQLYNQIQALRNNAQATEAAAREELGLVKPGEIFYRYAQ